MVIFYLLILIILFLSLILFLQRFKKVEESYHDQALIVEQDMKATDFVKWVEKNERY